MENNKSIKNVTSIVFVIIIAAFFILIISQFVIKNVFIEMLGMDNWITDMSVTGVHDGMIDVDFEKMYPHKVDTYELSYDEKIKEKGIVINTAKFNNPVNNKLRSLIDTIDKYSNDFLPLKEYVKIPSGLFDRAIDNRMVDTNNIYLHTGENGLIVRSPFKTSFTDEELDTGALSDSIMQFKSFLDKKNIDFMYVQAPIKEDKYDTEYVSQYGLSYENQLADNLLLKLENNNVDVLDLREELYNQQIDCYDSFFVTDNHWNIKTAFWATGEIAKRLNSSYGFSFDMNKFDLNNYDETVYEQWVQGTIGRSVTLVNAKYDDISVYNPKFETQLNIKIPNLNMDNTGRFLDTMINQRAFKVRNTIYHGGYDAFGYSKPPITEVTNLLETDNEKSVLLIRESFAGPVVAYMSLGIKNLYAITPEGYNGSIESYIESVNPDMVIVLYTAPVTNKMTVKYDFR